MDKKAALIILDGWGYGEIPEADAIQQADTPVFADLLENYPHATLTTHGEAVGLPAGQMGNSEVGHLNIGAGRIIYQELARINKAMSNGSFAENPELTKGINYAIENEAGFHLLGLVSDGGVHSHIDHLLGIIDILLNAGVKKIYIHAFTDGRDTDPTSGVEFIRQIQEHIEDTPAVLATVTGRYYAMDRDQRWERVKVAYEALTDGKGESSSNAAQTIKQRYDEKETDEFLKPIILTEDRDALINEGDVVLFFNFRTDRPRQLTRVLHQEDMEDHDMEKRELYYITMTNYDDSFDGIHILLQKENINETIGEILSIAGKSQVRIAETEKYPHVTFFFSGGREEAFEKESRILIPSPKVATYDQQPEMSAEEVTEAIIDEMKDTRPDFICLNFANPDMVGHTGDFDAAVKAVETVDECLGQILKQARKMHYEVLIIADHGNADFMINEDGTPNTAHTKNPVPIIYFSADPGYSSIRDGKLADIAPTLLTLLEMEIPEVMSGDVLVENS